MEQFLGSYFWSKDLTKDRTIFGMMSVIVFLARFFVIFGDGSYSGKWQPCPSFKYTFPLFSLFFPKIWSHGCYRDKWRTLPPLIDNPIL